MLRILIQIMVITGIAAALPPAQAAENIVYSVQRGLNMGNPGEKTHTDYYIDMGSRKGLKVGSQLTIKRRLSSYNLNSRKLYKDVLFPIAKVKVIHVEREASIARLVRMNDREKTPVAVPRAIMVGDIASP